MSRQTPFSSCFNDDGLGWKKIRELRKNIFDGHCPYTDQKCIHFKCEDCAVEEYEVLKLEEYLKEIGKYENNNQDTV